MCRLFALTSRDPVSPMRAIDALNVMKEGHDGSGVGLYLGGLGGPFGDLKDHPILSGIFTEAGLRRLDEYMAGQGFEVRHAVRFTPRSEPPRGTPRRGTYVAIAYAVPAGWEALSEDERGRRLVRIRLNLRAEGEGTGDMMVFSFWPDTVMIKEVGDPLEMGAYLDLGREELHARRILAQGRQNTNYAINLYACHPFFIEGVATMTNGENTAFVPIREYLMSRGVEGYSGYQSDSEVFTHIAHFTTRRLGLDIRAYKHVITPLSDDEMHRHPDREFLQSLKRSCRKLIIDGPNCVIGCLPDGTMFMVQDRKKLRPGVVGGDPARGVFAFSSEICGLNAAIPDRDKSKDFQPMHLDTAIVGPDCREVAQCSQNDPLPLQR
ncbi:MAG: glutamate synthase [Pseudomonadota bacterium]